MTVRRILLAALGAILIVSSAFVGRVPAASALTDSNVIVVGASECDGYVRDGHLASKLELAGYSPSIICISASSPAFGVDVAAMESPDVSTVVLTAGLNVRPVQVFDEPGPSLYAPETDSDGYITPAGFRSLVGDTIDALRDRGVERIIWFTTADYNHQWHDHYATNNAILMEEGRRLDFEVVSWDSMVEPELFGTDGVHYTDEGYELFADTIAQTATGSSSVPTSALGPCSYLSKGVSAQVGADVLGITEEEFLLANPHWNPYWRYGGIVCEPVVRVPHPLSSGTPVSGAVDGVLGYAPHDGALSEFFLGTPDGGGDAAIIGPVDAQSSGIAGADSVTWSSAGSLVLYASPTGEFRVMQRDSAGEWIVVQEMFGSSGWSHVVAGDYDGDGDTDLLFYRSRDGLMRFYSIRPSGGFEAMTPAMYGTHGWTDIVAGDYNGDGTDDVYWYRARDGLMRFYTITATGRFAPLTDAMNGTRDWSSIVEGRYDGANSGLLFYRDDGIARFYVVDPDRGFAAISSVLNVASAYRQVVAGDYNGDGSDDVFWYQSSGSVMTVLSNGVLVDLSGTTAIPQQKIFTSVPLAP